MTRLCERRRYGWGLCAVEERGEEAVGLEGCAGEGAKAAVAEERVGWGRWL